MSELDELRNLTAGQRSIIAALSEEKAQLAEDLKNSDEIRAALVGQTVIFASMMEKAMATIQETTAALAATSECLDKHDVILDIARKIRANDGLIQTDLLCQFFDALDALGKETN